MKKTLIALMALAGAAAADNITGGTADTNIDAIIEASSYEYGDIFTLTFTLNDCGFNSAASFLTLASDWCIVNQEDRYVGVNTSSGGPSGSYATRNSNEINSIDTETDGYVGWIVDSGTHWTGLDGSIYTITSSSEGTAITLSVGSREISISSTKALNLNDFDYSDGISISDNSTLSLGKNTYSIASGHLVPEPTTATLSLLALAGLAARRRRK